MSERVTPVEERIDHARRRRAELIVEDVGDREAHGNITAFQREARGVARDYLDLLTEHFAREEFRELAWDLWTMVVLPHIDKFDTLADPFGVFRRAEVLLGEPISRALPATEPAQPEEEPDD